jgi:type IV pilus assembly protein PilC
MTADELIALNEQIAGMARAGLPLDQGLASLAREMTRGRLRRVTEAIANDLKTGTTLPEAVNRRKAELPTFYGNLITTGLRTGRLPDVLATLTAYARTVAATRTIVIDAMFYPAVVLVFALFLFVALVFYVLPQFDQLFQEFGLALPLPTRIFLAAGRHPLYVLLPAVGILLGLFVLWEAMRSTARGKLILARVIYAVPIIGTLIRSARLAAFAELLAVLVEYELPLPEAFRLAGDASSDPIMARQAHEIHHWLDQGVALGSALRGRGLLPEWVAWMTGAGEQRGALAPTLRQIAALYRQQVEARAALLRSVLPAFMIIATAGVLTAAFAFTVMLPMIGLLSGLR